MRPAAPQCRPKVYVCCVLYVVMRVGGSLGCNFLVSWIPLSSGLGWGRCRPTLILTRPVLRRKGGLLPQILIRTLCLNSRGRGAVRSVVSPPFLVSPPPPTRGAQLPHLPCPSISGLSLPNNPYNASLSLPSPTLSEGCWGRQMWEESPGEAQIVLQGWSLLTDHRPSACSCLSFPCLESHPSSPLMQSPSPEGHLLPWPNKD